MKDSTIFDDVVTCPVEDDGKKMKGTIYDKVPEEKGRDVQPFTHEPRYRVVFEGRSGRLPSNKKKNRSKYKKKDKSRLV